MDFVRTLATTVVTVAVLLHPDECWAQTQQQMQAQQQHLMMSSRPPDEHFGVRGQYYDLSVGGLRDYVDTLRGDPRCIASSTKRCPDSSRSVHGRGWSALGRSLAVSR